jgi:hypothetical protein
MWWKKRLPFTMISIPMLSVAILDCSRDSAMGIYEIRPAQTLSREEIHSMVEILRGFLMALQANRQDFRVFDTLDALRARFGEAAEVMLDPNVLYHPMDEIMQLIPQRMDLILDTWLPQENAYGTVHFQEEGVEFLAENLLGAA